jgi:hypothetical protein
VAEAAGEVRLVVAEEVVEGVGLGVREGMTGVGAEAVAATLPNSEIRSSVETVACAMAKRNKVRNKTQMDKRERAWTFEGVGWRAATVGARFGVNTPEASGAALLQTKPRQSTVRPCLECLRTVEDRSDLVAWVTDALRSSPSPIASPPPAAAVDTST